MGKAQADSLPGDEVLSKLRKMRTLADEEEDSPASGQKGASSSAQPAWMRVLQQHCKTWLAALPEVCRLLCWWSYLTFVQRLSVLPKPAADNQDPLQRFFSREGGLGRKLLSTVRRDLADVVKVCEGALKQTNHLRTLMSELTKGMFELTVQPPC